MRKLILLSTILLLSITLNAAPVVFVKNAKSWEEIVQMARKSQKKIFVDVYTTWCGPCKKMDAEVFTDNGVGTYFNENFINVKIDAEKGWGIDFAKKNEIEAYPTYLFFNPDGKVISTALGFIAVPGFVKLGKSIVLKSPATMTMDQFAAKYASGNYTAGFLYKYIKTPGALKDKRDVLIEKYLSMLSEKEWGADSVQQMLAMNMKNILPDGYNYKALIAGYKAYPVKSGLLTSSWNTLVNSIKNAVEEAGAMKDRAKADKLIAAAIKLETIEYAKQREENLLNCIYYAAAGDAGNFKKYAENFYDQSVVKMDTAAVFNFDRAEFARCTPIEVAYTKRTPEQFKVSFRSESLLTLYGVNSLVFFYNQVLKVKDPAIEALLRKTTTEYITIYKNNPVNVNAYLITQAEKFTNSK